MICYVALLLITAELPVEASRPPAHLEVGDKAPLVLGVYPDGDASVVRAWTWDGTHTLLVFWSPNDPASIHQLRILRQLHREFGGEQFRIVSVASTLDAGESNADEWNLWIEFLGGQPHLVSRDATRRLFYSNRAWVQLFEAEAFDPTNFPPDKQGLTTAGRYGVTEFPSAFLVGPDGRLRAVRIPTRRLRRTVVAALE